MGDRPGRAPGPCRQASRDLLSSPASRRAAAGEEAEDIPLTVLINPEIEPLSEDKAAGGRGLPVGPGPGRARCRAGPASATARSTCTAACSSARPSGYHARVVQHECDHLDGILYPMRMTDLSSQLAFVEELRRFSGRSLSRRTRGHGSRQHL